MLPPSPTCCAAASRIVSARRASPSETRARVSTASSMMVTLPARPRSSLTARRISVARSSSDSDSSTQTRARDNSAALSSNDGFSVVAPINVTIPCSTAGRNASCWARLKRCISSTNRMVPRPSASRPSASLMISRTLGTPSLTAENGTKCRSVVAAIRRARVVLPVPGGPQKMLLPTSPRRIASPSGLPGASRCACPTNSSSRRGRIRAASGSGSANSESLITAVPCQFQQPVPVVQRGILENGLEQHREEPAERWSRLHDPAGHQVVAGDGQFGAAGGLATGPDSSDLRYPGCITSECGEVVRCWADPGHPAPNRPGVIGLGVCRSPIDCTTARDVAATRLEAPEDRFHWPPPRGEDQHRVAEAIDQARIDILLLTVAQPD